MSIPYWFMHLVKKLILVAVKMQVSFKSGLDVNFIPEISKNQNFRNFFRVIWFVPRKYRNSRKRGRDFRLFDPIWGGLIKNQKFEDFWALFGKFWKTHPNIFQNFHFFRVVTQTNFWKTHPGQLPKMDEFSRKRSECSPGKLKLWKDIWMSFPERKLVPKS